MRFPCFSYSAFVLDHASGASRSGSPVSLMDRIDLAPIAGRRLRRVRKAASAPAREKSCRRKECSLLNPVRGFCCIHFMLSPSLLYLADSRDAVTAITEQSD